MKVKTYKHESLQEGLEDIKRDLGSDALILGTRSVSVRPKFGLFKKPAWEITAAVEEKSVGAVYDRPQSPKETSPAVTDRRYSAPKTPSANKATAAAAAPA